MLRGFLVLISLLLVSPQSYAFDAQDLGLLHTHVQRFTDDYYRQTFGEERFTSDVEVAIGNLDNRLRLAACDDNLAFKIIEPPHSAHNITVKTSCKGQQPWTIYIPATVNVFEDIVVANRSLSRGDVLTAEDLAFKRVNTATIGRGLVADIRGAEGLELKRPLRTGETIRSNYLKKPDVVKKGQAVVVSSRSRFLTVETTGVALVDGHLGERIRVRNDKSNRVIDAEVVAPGKVSVAAR